MLLRLSHVSIKVCNSIKVFSNPCTTIRVYRKKALYSSFSTTFKCRKGFYSPIHFSMERRILSSNSFFNGKEDFITSIHLSMERRIGTDNSNFPNKI